MSVTINVLLKQLKRKSNLSIMVFFDVLLYYKCSMLLKLLAFKLTFQDFRSVLINLDFTVKIRFYAETY